MKGKIENLLVRLKNIYFRTRYGNGIHPTARFYGRGIVLRGTDIKIGARTTVNNYVVINATESSISIGDRCRVSDGVNIVAVGLDANRHHVPLPVIIDDNVWLGTGCIILPGVHIGENSVIGAGAVVTKDIPANMTAVGVPARVLTTVSEIQK